MSSDGPDLDYEDLCTNEYLFRLSKMRKKFQVDKYGDSWLPKPVDDRRFRREFRMAWRMMHEAGVLEDGGSLRALQKKVERFEGWTPKSWAEFARAHSPEFHRAVDEIIVDLYSSNPSQFVDLLTDATGTEQRRRDATNPEEQRLTARVFNGLAYLRLDYDGALIGALDRVDPWLGERPHEIGLAQRLFDAAYEARSPTVNKAAEMSAGLTREGGGGDALGL